jgi:peptidoglycan/xylan/chitin deacetylase (PgdA/CDA1 family)
LKSLETELVTVQSELKRKSGLTCRYLAYPYGGRNSLVDALTQKYGYRAAFTVKRGSNPFFIQDFQVQRSMIYGDWGIEQFKKNLKAQIDLKP